MVKLHKFINFFLVAIIAVSCSTSKKDLVLATFTDGSISTNEYLDHYLLSTQYKPDVLPTEENLKEIVLNKALEKMSVQEAEVNDIQHDSLFLSILENNKRRLLFENYVHTEIISKIVTDSLIAKFYDEFTPQYRMKYIMRPFLRTSSKKFIDSQEESINNAYSLLIKGTTFKDVVEKYSQDITTNKKGGDLGWMIRESMGDEALRLVMDTLSSFTYSKPFKGYGGYYILYKGEKRDVVVPPLSEIKPKIWQSLYRSRKAFIQNGVEKRFLELSKKYSFIKNEQKIESIFSKITGVVKIKDSTPMNFDKLSADDKSVKIASYSNGSIALADLFADRKKAPTNREEFFNRLQNISQQHLFAKNAEEKNLQNNVELKDKIENMRTSLLRTILYQRKVKDEVQKKILTMEDISPKEKVKKRVKIENDLRTNFENKLKNKFKFKFVEENFSSALNLASVKKEEQNLARNKSK